MIGFDQAVAAVVEWVSQVDPAWEDTLLIVTGDHETGYITRASGIFPNIPLASPGAGILPTAGVHFAWNSTSHTNSLVPVYARGIGIHLFSQFAKNWDPGYSTYYLDNTKISTIMRLGAVTEPTSATGLFIALSCLFARQKLMIVKKRGARMEQKYLEASKEFLTTLIEKGTDRYGKRETPVFCLCLDPETYTPPKAPEKIDRDYAISFEYLYRDFGFYWKSHLHGSNLIYDQGTIRAMYLISDMTGDAKYRAAADAYLDFFLDNLVSEQTGIFGWGEHIFYNVFLDYLIGGCFQTSGWHYFYYGHELERWTTIYDILWEKDPEKTRNEIEAIYDFKIHDYETFICNRHSQYYSGRSDDVYTFIKHTGLFAHAFALAHAKTGDPKYLVWAKKMSEVFWRIRNPETNLVRHCVQEHWGGPKTCSGSGIGELSLFLMRAYQWSPEPEFLEKAHAYLRAYNKYFRIGESSFRAEVNCDGTDARPGELADYWEGPIRCAKAAALAYSLTKDSEMLELADVVVKNVTPEVEFDSVVERSLVSDAIEARSAVLSTALDLYEVTGDKQYLVKAQTLADDAITRYLHNGLFVSGLSFDLYARPRRPTTYVYDARAGAGWLALNLLRLQRDLNATKSSSFAVFEQLERIYD